jgi:hypothetical protein
LFLFNWSKNAQRTFQNLIHAKGKIIVEGKRREGYDKEGDIHYVGINCISGTFVKYLNKWTKPMG